VTFHPSQGDVANAQQVSAFIVELASGWHVTVSERYLEETSIGLIGRSAGPSTGIDSRTSGEIGQGRGGQ
jgi:hypothetical protein